MSDGNRAEDAASDMDSTPVGQSPAILARSSDAPDRAASSGVFSTLFNAVSSAMRPMNLTSILNNDADEVVAGSDQDGDQASPTGVSSGLVAVAMQLQPTTVHSHAVEADALGQDDAAAGLLMGLAISASHDDSIATTTMTNEAEAMQADPKETPSQAETEDVAMAEVVATDAAEQVKEVPEPRRDKRGRIIPPRTKTAKGKAKATKKAPSKASAPHPAAAVDAANASNGLVATEPETLVEGVQPQPATKRTREKRRTPPPPAPVQATPSKKPKATAKTPPVDVAPVSTRPKREAKFVRSYTEITLVDDDEDDDYDFPMVIASENVKASLEAEAAEAAAKAAAAKAASVSAASGKKVVKRKTMSKRQFDELMSDDVVDASNDVEVYEVEELAPVAPVPQTAPGVKQRPCAFCHLDHSAFAMFYCHSCHRMYHGKCLVDAFRPAMKEGVPIEDQMEELILHRPKGHSPVLRCVSCQAAFIDLHNRPEVHRDCTCPTCLKSPQKMADYRRVSLKMIVDQHNIEFALKREQQKGGKGGKKTGTTAAPPPTKTPATKTTKARGTAAKVETAAPATPAEETAPSGRARGARSTRRTRDSDEPDEEDNHPAPGSVAVSEPELLEQQAVIPATNKAEVVVSIKSGRRVRGRGSKVSAEEPMVVDSSIVEEAEAMEVDSEATSHTNGLPNGDTKTTERVEAVDTDEVTESTYEQLIQITKDDAGDSWSFRVACSSSGKANESGMYKEAIFVWHPTRDKEFECCCCNKSKQSLRWFVQHTDPSLLARNDDPYAYMFVVQKNGKLVPLEQVLLVMRAARSKQRRLSGGNEQDHNVKDELSEERKQALAALHDVVFKPIVHDRKRRSSNPGVLPEFACDVVCAEGRYMCPLVSDNSLLRCSFNEVSNDVWRRGELEVRENPRNTRTCKIFCECCNDRLTAKQFREHLQKPLELARDEQVKADEQQRKDRLENGFDSDDQELSSQVNPQPPRSVSVAVGVWQRHSTALKMDRFFWAIEQLGSQAEINKAIATIVQTQGG